MFFLGRFNQKDLVFKYFPGWHLDQWHIYSWISGCLGEWALTGWHWSEPVRVKMHLVQAEPNVLLNCLNPLFIESSTAWEKGSRWPAYKWIGMMFIKALDLSKNPTAVIFVFYSLTPANSYRSVISSNVGLAFIPSLPASVDFDCERPTASSSWADSYRVDQISVWSPVRHGSHLPDPILFLNFMKTEIMRNPERFFRCEVTVKMACNAILSAHRATED